MSSPLAGEATGKNSLSRENSLLARQGYCSLPPAVRRRLVAIASFGQFPVEEEFYQNNPQCRPDNGQGVDQFKKVFSQESEVMDQETGKLHPGLVQPVKNKVDAHPADKPYKSPKTIICVFHD